MDHCARGAAAIKSIAVKSKSATLAALGLWVEGGVMKLIVFIAIAALLFAETKPQAKGSVQRIKVHGKSLEGNLEGDSPDREVSIYLPPGYDANRNQRYPVVYLLHGYLLTDQFWTSVRVSMGGADIPGGNVPSAMDNLLANGAATPMIIVMPNAYSIYAGSMYSSSVTTGDWEAYVAEDLVAYIDTHYRTIPNRMSRGLAGHSMGGYGAIRIGMKRPDVFSSLYILSACCLINNPFPPPPANSKQNDTKAGGGFPPQLNSAWAAAFSPNPKNPPAYFDEPYKDGREQPLVIAKWHAASPLAMIDQYVTNLKKYQATMADVGLQDGLAGQNKQLDQMMTEFGIMHTFETYEGDHTSKIPDRIETKVLPFFSKNLASKKLGR
jgi:S-formylglutathione hydrolase